MSNQRYGAQERKAEGGHLNIRQAASFIIELRGLAWQLLVPLKSVLILQKITKVASCMLQATAADTNPHHNNIDSPGFQLYFHAEHLVGDQVINPISSSSCPSSGAPRESCSISSGCLKT